MRHRPSQVESLEATMDISSSSEDEGQIIDSSRNPSVQSQSSPEHPRGEEQYEDEEEFEPELTEAHDQEGYVEQPVLPDSQSPESDGHKDSSTGEMEVDNYEEYEPADITPLRQSPGAPISIHSSDDDTREAVETTYSPTLAQGNVERARALSSPSPERHLSNMHEEGEISDGSNMDSDDYEPPEPSTPVDNEMAADNSSESVYHEVSNAQPSEAGVAEFSPNGTASDAADDALDGVPRTVVNPTEADLAQDDDDAGSSAEVWFIPLR